MIKLGELRYKQKKEVKAFAEELEISPTTLTRIEAAERQGRKHRVSYGVEFRIRQYLSQFFKRDITVSDLAGVELVQPRPGRPKKTEE